LKLPKIANEKEGSELEPQKEVATFEDFSKLDLRVGTILTAEKKGKRPKKLNGANSRYRFRSTNYSFWNCRTL